jgi:hypothetical protein
MIKQYRKGRLWGAAGQYWVTGSGKTILHEVARSGRPCTAGGMHCLPLLSIIKANLGPSGGIAVREIA